MGKYDDIVNLPHWEPRHHRRMSGIDRAGQFAPFAALTGYDAMVAETSRLTGERLELDDGQRMALDEALSDIVSRITEHPRVSVTHFVRDTRKDGGAYVRTVGTVRDVDLTSRTIVLKEGPAISLDDVLELLCPVAGD